MNPNLVINIGNKQTNVIYELRYVEYDRVAAETIRMLLENGGKTEIAVDGEMVFDELDYDVIFDVFHSSDTYTVFSFKFELNI